MHVSSLSVDLNWLVQFVFTLVVIFVGLGYLLLKNTASNYFLVDANSDSIGSSPPSSPSSSSSRGASSGASVMPGIPGGDGCAVCGNPTTKHCSRCKAVKYCTATCQSTHWRKEHKFKCKASDRRIVAPGGFSSIQKQVDKILFPYNEFVKLFNWDKPAPRPCGLINCGNSCFANVVLQCLAHTRPLVAYLMDKGHRKECRRNEWCFLCELQCHLERVSHQQPFSPVSILSRLPSIGGNLGYGKQEDAHEFMRFAIDTMQSVCLDENGGEKLIHPKSQETTLIQHIFGGQLQSQVICTQCNQVSNQYENMMDLTVEIQGDAASLEECLDQFTMKEWLHGDNMYKCDGCNDYVKAWKRLTIRQAPNILTIALKRFQSGRFGKLNKKITFPEMLNLTPYMSEEGDHTDKYKLYGVVVHVDMLNASFFGHYICYIKDLQGTWYRIDDCKVVMVELDEVLSQGAYMLLYSRISARATCLKTFESPKKEKLDNSEMQAEKCYPEKHVNFVSDTGDIPLRPDRSVPIEDDKDGDGFSYVPLRHTHAETSSFVSSPREAHTITSEPFTNGFHVESSCSQWDEPTSIYSSTAYITSYEMQQVTNSVQLHKSEDIVSENNLPTPFSLDAQDAAFEMNGTCKLIPHSDSPSKSIILALQSEPERRQNQTEGEGISSGPVILNQMATGNDNRETVQNGYEDIRPECNGSTSSSSQSCIMEEEFSSLASEMNGDCKHVAVSDSLKESIAAQQSATERCQNGMVDESRDPMILDDEISPDQGRPGSIAAGA